MDKLILAGNAQTHPTASLVVGAIVCVIALAAVVWLIGKVTK